MLKELFEKCAYTTNWINIGNDVQYYSEVRDNITFIYFQPSSSTMDWKINFSFLLKPYKRMKELWFAHSGFVHNYKSCGSEFLNIAKNTKHLVIAGYSHGAAMALLATEDIKFNYPDLPVYTYCFGCPRVFSWITFAPKLRDRLKDVVLVNNKRDIVSKVPFFFLGFTHIGNKKDIGKNGYPCGKYHKPSEYMKELKNL